MLLHVTSLPGPHRHGVIDENAYRFVDLIAAAGFTVWQTLPIGPVDAAGSPYSLRSAHAGNPDLLDPSSRVGPAEMKHLARFARIHRRWLLPLALFSVLSERYDGAPWWEWPAALRNRQGKSIRQTLITHRAKIRQVLLNEYLFDVQWRKLKSYANDKGVFLFGDLPFYVDRNSVDVWWQRELFELDEQGIPIEVAGVPPDYFSEDGQLWGNPLYDWGRMEKRSFRWWVERLRHQHSRFDLVRLDHFRAFESFWAVPADAKSAREGRWRAAPGAALLNSLRSALGGLPLVAEDLGTITPAVHALRDQFDLPGMLVLQFAFDGTDTNPYLPANHSRNAVVYTGTHDNDTTVGWYQSLDEASRNRVRESLGCAGDTVPEHLVAAAYASGARLAILPMQDLLGLGSQARMNTPGTTAGNWQWRFYWPAIPDDFVDRFSSLARQHDRAPDRISAERA